MFLNAGSKIALPFTRETSVTLLNPSQSDLEIALAKS
jgi:hypothetical protein